MKKIIFIGICVFLASALWQLPLSVAQPYAEKFIKGLHLKDVSGTIWNGNVGSFTIAKTNLEKVKWHAEPLQSLRTLSLKFTFDIDSRNFNVQGLVGITPKQTLILDNTQFDLDAKYLNTLQKYAELSGDIKGNIKHAEINQQDLPIIDAVIDWKEAALTSPVKLAKGDYNAVILPISGNMDIKLSSSDAPMELDGKIKLNKEWIYNSDLNIKSEDPGIGSMISLLGEKQANGVVNVKKQGDLKPFIGK